VGLSTDPDGQARLMDNDRYLQALRQRSAVMPYGMPVSSDPEASDAYGEGVVRGVAKNLRARAGDFINALRSPMETLGGIVETGKQIVRDPKGSVRAMAQAEALRAANTASGPEAAGEYAASFFDPLRFAGAVRRGLPPAIAMADEPTRLELPKSAQQLKKLQDMAFDEYKKGEISWDDYTSRADKLIDARVKIELAEQRATNLGKIKPVWKSMTRIPVGTRVRGSHGLNYKNATGVVTGTRVMQMNDGLYTLPVVDFGDGKPRTLTTFDIEQVFTPHSVD
jgi:hypothetical protein